MEALAGLFGALIGGAFALVGAWYSIKWQTERESRAVAISLAAELSVAQRMLEEGQVAALYQQILDQLKATGRVPDRQLLIDLFDNQPQDALPVYYSMAGKLGHLPPDIAADLVEYHALIIALPRTIVRFLGKRELPEQAVKDLAISVERQWNKANDMRASLIARLSAFGATGALAKADGGERR